VDITHDSKRYRKVSPDNTKEGAKAYEALLRRKLATGEEISKREEVIAEIPKLSEFTEQWFNIYVKNNNKVSEIKGKYYIFNKHILPFFGDKKLDKIGPLSIGEYINAVSKKGLSNKTINNHLTALRTCLNTAKDWGILGDAPKIKQLKTPPSSFVFLSLVESEALLESATGFWKLMILTALKTGLRLGELRGLKWEDIDFTRRVLTVKRSIYKKDEVGPPKSNKYRVIPLSNGLYYALLSERKERGFVFQYKLGLNIRNDICRNELFRICDRAGIKRISWHPLRHTFASRLIQRGVNPVVVKSLLGHSDIRTTMIYCHIDFATLQTSVNILDEDLGHNTVTKLQEREEITSLLPVQNTHLLPLNKQKQDVSPVLSECGTDGGRTRDLLRDRQAL